MPRRDVVYLTNITFDNKNHYKCPEKKDLHLIY